MDFSTAATLLLSASSTASLWASLGRGQLQASPLIICRGPPDKPAERGRSVAGYGRAIAVPGCPLPALRRQSVAGETGRVIDSHG